MKRFGRSALGLLLAVLLVTGALSVLLPVKAQAAWDREGYTPVSNQEGLEAISEDPSGNYYLTKDIALTGTWVPIDQFSGILDGNGCTITKVTAVQGDGDTYAGLFFKNDGSIRNLTVKLDVELMDCTSLYFGGVVCTNRGEVVNCTAEGTVKLGADTVMVAGAIVGTSESGGMITHCSNRATMTVSAEGCDLKLGGVVGASKSTVQHSSNSGTVTVDSGESADAALYVGGVAGTQSGGFLLCHNEGKLTVDTAGQVSLGGIVGNTTGDIDRCYNTGDVTIQSKRNSGNTDQTKDCLQYIGGLAGETNNSILNSYGVSAVNSTIHDDYDTGLAFVKQGGLAGTILGSDYQNSFFIGTMIYTGETVQKGGISGHAQGGGVGGENGYWYAPNVSYQNGNDYGAVIDKLPADGLTEKSNYSGFSFGSAYTTAKWVMGPSHPLLCEQDIHLHYTEIIPGYAATCTEDGMEDGEFCLVCGEIALEPQVIPAPGHDWQATSDVFTEQCATCKETQGAVLSGYCGADADGTNLIWTLDGEGTMTISGEGDMANYIGKYPPWFDYRDPILTLDVQEGVTSIGYGAFNGCEFLNQVNLPDSLTFLDDTSFCGCIALQQITIPKAVTTIDSRAFLNCSALTEIRFEGNAPTTISSDAFKTVVANAYYPIDDETWTEAKRQNYGGTLTWMTYGTHVHTEEIIPGYAATCEATGLTDGKKCTVCGEITAAQEIIPLADHTEEVIPGYAATCEATGLTDGKKCTVCGEITAAQEIIPLADHTEEVIPGYAATCTTMGRTDGKRCSVCEITLQAQQNISALGHSWQATDDVFVEQCGTCGTTRTNTFNGTCGTGVTWTLTADGTLTISGSGEMSGYADAQSAPWAAYADAIVSIVVEEGITGLGSNTFACCTAVKTLTLPNSVDALYMNEFTQCTLLEKVTVDNHRDAFVFDATLFPANMKVIFLRQSPALDIFAGGEGTEANPYLVATPAQLDAVREYLHAHYLQIADIDMKDVAWEPIGNLSGSNQLRGGYDGGSYKISNLTIVSDHDAVGMFGACAEASLKNIILENLSITVNDSVAALPFIGGLAGTTAGSIENCSVSGIITANVPYSGYFGGICGDSHGLITNCTSSVTINCSAPAPWSVCYVGGIAGYAERIANCSNTGSITAADTGEGTIAGGIVGKNYKEVTNCRNSGSVTVTATAKGYAGGIVGETDKVIQQCVNTGAVEVKGGGQLYAGGIGGSFTGTMENCFNTGSVKAQAVDADDAVCYAGGIAGYLEGSLDCVYSLAQLTAADGGTNCKGSLAAYKTDAASLTDAYYCNCSQLPYAGVGNAAGGTACTAAEMKTKSTYAGFDFTDVWSMDPDAAYPYPVLQVLDVTLPDVELGISGICGDDMTWSLDEQGVLTFSGTGEMYDYQQESQPWLDYLDQIRKVVVEEGVTSIGAGAFWSDVKYQLTGGLTLPSTLETIGDHAFQYCMGLGTVQIPDGVTSIGEWAFQTSGGLTTVTVGSGIRNIGAHAFDIDDAPERVTVSIDAYVSQVTQGEEVFGDSVTVIFKTCADHTWGEGGCTEQRTCTVCSAVEEQARGHQEEIVAGYAATCTVDGLTDGKKCTVCGETTVEQKPIIAEGHKEETLAGYAATCTDDGLTEGKKCTVCGVTTVAQETIPAAGHKEETLAGYAATCTDDGLTEGKKCTVCGVTTVAQETIPAAGHKEETLAGYAATCTENGLTDGKKCTVCGETTVEQKPIIAEGHKEETLAGYAATCTVDGLTEGKKCTVCGEVTVKQETIIAEGHKEETLAGYAATCTDDGLTEGKKCTVCGETTVAQTVIPVIPHDDADADGACDSCQTVLQYIVTFDTNGGVPVPGAQKVAPGGLLEEPEEPVRKNQRFCGWVRKGDNQIWDFDTDTVEENLVLEAQWHKDKHHVHGHIHLHGGGRPGHRIKMALKQGNLVIRELETDEEGYYEIDELPAGIYNLIAEDKDGRVTTTMVEIRADGKIKPIEMPEHNVRAELIVPDEEGNDIVVGGLDVIADQHHAEDTSVTVTMKVGKTEDITEEDAPEEDKKAQKEAQKAIKEQAKKQDGQDEEDDRDYVFLDIKIERKEGQRPAEELADINGLLEIRVPVETHGRKGFKVYRHHEDQIHELCETPNGNGEYIEVHDGYVVIHARYFSMYAVTSLALEENEPCTHEYYIPVEYLWNSNGCQVTLACTAGCGDTKEADAFTVKRNSIAMDYIPDDLKCVIIAGYSGGQMKAVQVVDHIEGDIAFDAQVSLCEAVKVFFLNGVYAPLQNPAE